LLGHSLPNELLQQTAVRLAGFHEQDGYTGGRPLLNFRVRADTA
jgi:hypothetical protein